MDRIAELADTLRALGSKYRFHGELMLGALQNRQENAITWHLLQVLEQLEKET